MKQIIILLCITILGACANVEETEAPTFSEVYDTVLGPSCAFSSCHGSGAGGLTFTEESAWQNLVQVPSEQLPDVLRVSPGTPDSSYLIWKVESNEAIQKDSMPPNGTLEAEKIEKLRAWIKNGALDD